MWNLLNCQVLRELVLFPARITVLAADRLSIIAPFGTPDYNAAA